MLRAVALREGVPVSAVTTATYLVGESTGLPVLSLVTEPAHLWDEVTGIYVNAEGARPGMGAAGDGGVAIAGGEPGFSVGAGLRIHGWGSRGQAKQSFRLYFRGEYGPRELAYPLFGVEPGQTYDRLVLRAGATTVAVVGDVSGWGSVRAGSAGPGPARGDGAGGGAGALGGAVPERGLLGAIQPDRAH